MAIFPRIVIFKSASVPPPLPEMGLRKISRFLPIPHFKICEATFVRPTPPEMGLGKIPASALYIACGT